jgi:hypothetical protein
MEKAGVKVMENALKRCPDRLEPEKSIAFADFYSYIFHKAFQQVNTRENRWMTLQIFVRGVMRSSKFLSYVAKRRVLLVMRDLIFDTGSRG